MKENLKTMHTKAQWTNLDSEQVLRVEKSGKIDRFDENTMVLIEEDQPFHNGMIEVKMRSRLLPGAPDFARGFIGIVFRAKPDGSEFESYYVRPANGNHPDPVRRAHGSQYFSYPGYTFSYFREFGIEGYEAPVNIQLDEWITLKAVIIDEKASFFVGDMEHPVLEVADLKHGANARGAVGFYVDTGTEAFFKDWKTSRF